MEPREAIRLSQQRRRLVRERSGGHGEERDKDSKQTGELDPSIYSTSGSDGCYPIPRRLDGEVQL